ncbi:MoxR family ATPase [Eubacteriales bacterium OttesenSCG-928-A19]|nr:MoxR family ATPase [Eubacteriales bacterium OttesenSCG-928-A19]
MRKELEAMLGELENVISGKAEVIQNILMAMLAGGHILLDDVPGVGKTTLAVALGKVMSLASSRIQFTPDVLPSDIVGYSIYNKQTGSLEYKPGAVIGANLLLGDEINRTSSKTQSAFLEAMEEHQVTVDGVTHRLERPFVVIATQNNVGTAGTQLLPYAQLDRFMACLSLGYPDHASQLDLLRKRQNANPLDALKPVLSLDQVLRMQEAVQSITAKDSILEYISGLAIATREHEMVQVGLSPRGALHLDRMAKANAFFEERDYVIPEDVRVVFAAVSAHRVIVTPNARMSAVTPGQVLSDVLKSVPVPDWKQ